MLNNSYEGEQRRELDFQARVCVLERRLDDHAREHGRDDAARDARLQTLEDKSAGLRTDFEVLKSRVAMYAALGAAVGGLAVNLLSGALAAWLKLP